MAAILVFVVALLYIMFSTAFSGSLGAQTQNIRVPSVTGQLFSEAQANTELLNGFTLVQGETVESDQPAGTILQQSPNANDFVSGDNMTITVTVSSGEAEEIKMPDLEGQTLSQALGTLDDLNLGLEYDYNSRTSYHDTIPKDSVISTYPTEGTVLHEGQQIILEMSLGPAEKTSIVPSLIGRTLEEATADLDAVGLTLNQVQESNTDQQPAGKVFYQSITAGTEVAQGTAIDIFISLGPSGSGSGSGDAVTKTFTLTLPTNLGEDLHVEVVDSQEQTVFSGDYNINLDTAAEIPVSGSGVQTYTIYINGHSYTQQTVDFGA